MGIGVNTYSRQYDPPLRPYIVDPIFRVVSIERAIVPHAMLHTCTHGLIKEL